MNAKTLLIALTACCLFSPTLHANDIWGEDGDFMEDDSNAKVAKHTAKQRAREANMSKEERAKARQNNDSCGSVDIGNVKGGGNVDNVVIIKGDVINANNINSCKFEIKGSSDIDASGLHCQHGVVEAQGSSELSVFASKTLSGTLMGATDLDVSGDPAKRNVKTLGASDVSYR